MVAALISATLRAKINELACARQLIGRPARRATASGEERCGVDDVDDFRVVETGCAQRGAIGGVPHIIGVIS
jgi:hypothetical protein